MAAVEVTVCLLLITMVMKTLYCVSQICHIRPVRVKAFIAEKKGRSRKGGPWGNRLWLLYML